MTKILFTILIWGGCYLLNGQSLALFYFISVFSISLYEIMQNRIASGIFTLIFLFYTSTYALQYSVINKSIADAYVDEGIRMSAAALFSLVLVRQFYYLFNKLKITDERQSMAFGARANAKPYTIAALCLLAAIIYSFYKISKSGYSTKQEITREGLDTLNFIAYSYTLCCLFIYSLSIKQFYWKSTYIICAWSALILFAIVIMGISGEREALFFVLLAALIWGYDKFKLGRYRLIIPFLALVAYLMMGATHKLKTFLINSNDAPVAVLSMEDNEFGSAGYNFSNILATYRERNQYGQMIYQDVTRFFGSQLLGFGGLSSATDWYKNTYLGKKGAGVGFSLLALGYLDFGLFGVLFMGGLLGFILALCETYNGLWIDRRLLCAIAVFSLGYSLRADLANLGSLLLKQSLLPIFLLSLIRKNDHKRKSQV